MDVPKTPNTNIYLSEDSSVCLLRDKLEGSLNQARNVKSAAESSFL
jgi:hypothetical protein